MCKSICTCLTVYVCECVCRGARACVRECLCLCIFVFTSSCTCTHVCTYMRTYIHTYIHTYILTYLHTYILTYIHTYIHTYKFLIQNSSKIVLTISSCDPKSERKVPVCQGRQWPAAAASSTARFQIQGQLCDGIRSLDRLRSLLWRC